MSTAATHSYPAEPRTATGSKATAKLRKSGKVPLTLTKSGHPSQLYAMDAKALRSCHRNVIHLCKLEVGDGKVDHRAARRDRHRLHERLGLQHNDLYRSR